MIKSENFFFYVLVPFVVVVLGASFVRYVIFKDYTVAYEVECDQSEHVCFVGCDDEVCTNQYFYKRIQKYAPNLMMQCGEDVTGCEAANECLPEDGEKCSIIYCDPAVLEDECEYVEQELQSHISNDVNQEIIYNTETAPTQHVNNNNDI